MQTLCASKGAAYLHVLQPTLHDPGSKIITERERELGIGAEALDPRIATYYSALRERGAMMVKLGLPFLDASRLFKDISEPLYHDRAHFGTTGNRLLAGAIFERLKDILP